MKTEISMMQYFFPILALYDILQSSSGWRFGCEHMRPVQTAVFMWRAANQNKNGLKEGGRDLKEFVLHRIWTEMRQQGHIYGKYLVNK